MPLKSREAVRESPGSLPTSDRPSSSQVRSRSRFLYRGDWRQFSDLNVTVHAEPAARIANWGLGTDPPRAAEAARRQCDLGPPALRTPRSFPQPHAVVCKAPA
jgi:hypothetical protein